MKGEESASSPSRPPPPVHRRQTTLLEVRGGEKSAPLYSHTTSIRNTWVCIKLKLTDLSVPKRTFMTKLNIVLLRFSARTSGEPDLVKLDLN